MQEQTTVNPLLRDTSIQGHKLWSNENKNVYIIFVSDTSIKETPLFGRRVHKYLKLTYSRDYQISP